MDSFILNTSGQCTKGRIWLPASAASRLGWCELRLIGWLAEGVRQDASMQKLPSGQALPMRKKSSFLESQAGCMRGGQTTCIRQEGSVWCKKLHQANQRRMHDAGQGGAKTMEMLICMKI